MKFCRRMAFVLLLIMLTAVINGCGENRGKDILEPWMQANKLDPVVLTMYLPPSPQYYSAYYGTQLLNEVTKALNERLKMINAKLEIGNVILQNDSPPLKARVNEIYWAAVQSGQKMDLFVINNSSLMRPDNYYLSYTSYLPFIIKKLGEENLAADLSEIFPRYAPKYHSMFEKEELDLLTYKGKLLAIPSLNYPTVSRTVAVVREDLMQKYKIKPIESLDDYVNFLATIRKNEPGMVPLLLGALQWERVDMLYDYFGCNYGYADLNGRADYVYRIDDPEIKLVAWERTKEYLDIAGMLREWNSKGYIRGLKRPDMFDVLSGEYASFIGKTGTAENYNQILDDNGGKPWKYVEYELFPESTVTREFNPFPIICVNPNSPNKERAVMLIEVLMNDQKSYDIFTCGIENKDFKYGKDKKPTEMVPSGYDLYNDSYMKNHAKWSFRNIFMQHEDEKAVNKKLKALKKNTVLNPIAGLVIDSEKQSNLPVDRQDEYRNTVIEKFILGQASDSEIREYLENIKDILDSDLSEYQRQVDEWKAEKELYAR